MFRACESTLYACVLLSSQRQGAQLAQPSPMIEFLLLVSRQGKVRLAKWYEPMTAKEKTKAIRDASAFAIGRPAKLSNVLEWQGDKRLVCKRYASLHFVAGISAGDNELLVLETIHHFVEVLDRYFGNVCELDLIFNFHKAYYVLDEILLDGVVQETSKKTVLKYVHMQEALLEEQNSSTAAAILDS